MWCDVKSFFFKKRCTAKWKIPCRVIYWSAGAGDRKASEIGRRRFSLPQEKMCLIWETACYEMCLAFDLWGGEQRSGIPGCVWIGLQGSSSPSSLIGLKVTAWVIQTVGVWPHLTSGVSVKSPSITQVSQAWCTNRKEGPFCKQMSHGLFCPFLIGILINVGGQRASWGLRLPSCPLLWEPKCPVEERPESMALTGAAAVAPTHISSVLFDIQQDTVNASFKID